MSTDDVKLGRLFAEIVSSHDVSRFDEIVAPGYMNHNPFAEPGPEGVKKVFGAIIAGVPDLRCSPKMSSSRQTARRGRPLPL